MKSSLWDIIQMAPHKRKADAPFLDASALLH